MKGHVKLDCRDLANEKERGSERLATWVVVDYNNL